MAWARRFGEANARAFDRHGWPYFTGESYDLLYPGYGDSWPSLLGAIGMTYEQAGGGSAGLAFERTAGDTLTLPTARSQHRTAGQATLRSAAAGKSDLVLGFARGAPDRRGRAPRRPPRARTTAGGPRRWWSTLGGRGSRWSGRRAVPGGRDRVPRATTAGATSRRAPTACGCGSRAGASPSPCSSRRRSFAPSTRTTSAPGRSPTPTGSRRTRRGRSPPAGGRRVTAAGPGAETLPRRATATWSPPTTAAPAAIRFLRAGGTAHVLRRATTTRRPRVAGRELVHPGGAAIPTWRSRAREAGLGGIAVPVRTGLAEAGSISAAPTPPPYASRAWRWWRGWGRPHLVRRPLVLPRAAHRTRLQLQSSPPTSGASTSPLRRDRRPGRRSAPSTRRRAPRCADGWSAAAAWWPSRAAPRRSQWPGVEMRAAPEPADEETIASASSSPARSATAAAGWRRCPARSSSSASTRATRSPGVRRRHDGSALRPARGDARLRAERAGRPSPPSAPPSGPPPA
jgi:hypothetical protein